MQKTIRGDCSLISYLEPKKPINAIKTSTTIHVDRGNCLIPRLKQGTEQGHNFMTLFPQMVKFINCHQVFVGDIQNELCKK